MEPFEFYVDLSNLQLPIIDTNKSITIKIDSAKQIGSYKLGNRLSRCIRFAPHGISINV